MAKKSKRTYTKQEFYETNIISLVERIAELEQLLSIYQVNEAHITRLEDKLDMLLHYWNISGTKQTGHTKRLTKTSCL